MRLLQSISFSTANLIDPLSEQPATEHARKHLSLSRLDSLESELELLCNFETTATEHACRLITAVSLHCKLSLALLLQSMAVSFYPHSYANLDFRKTITLDSDNAVYHSTTPYSECCLSHHPADRAVDWHMNVRFAYSSLSVNHT